MAKNITREEWASICGYGAVRAPSTADTTTKKEYVGHLTGDVTGNADTATALKKNWQLNLVGDVSGSAVLNNSDTNLSVTVQEAQHAVNADNAKQTQACAHASFADLANLATLAIKSQTSINSEYAVEAQHAETATNADNAEYAKEAQHSVKSDLATNATNATNAVKATRDGNGNQIDTTYMTKIEGATKAGLLKNIFVKGKALGSGTVQGNDATIYITSILGGGGEGSSTKFIFVTELPEDANINYVYINPDAGLLWIYDSESGAWSNVLIKLTGDITALNQSINTVSASIDTKISTSETNVLGQVDVKINSAKNYTDVQISTAKVEVNTYTDNSVNNAKTSLNETITNKTENAKNEANSYTDAQINETDTKISELSAKIDSVESKAGGGLELGDIGQAVFPIDENQMKRRYLNGQTILINQYQSFLERLKTAITTYPSLACTEEEWQSIAIKSAVGQCGKFVIDESAGTIRLPKIVMPIQGLIDLASLGEIVYAGLPNVTAGDDTTYLLAQSNVSSDFNNGAIKIVGTTPFYAYTQGGAPKKAFFDASLSNSIYGNSETVQPEAVQYPYFIQVATGLEEIVPAEKELTLNNPYSLLEHKIVDCKLNNTSWLRSEGQFNSGDVYSDAYNLLLSEKNTPTRDFVIKTTSDAYTDYDFVLNTTDKTFRLPLFTSERQLLEKKEPTNDDPRWYNLYSDGWCEQGGEYTGSPFHGSNVDVTFLKQFKDTSYTVLAVQKAINSTSYPDSVGVGFNNKTKNKVSIGIRNFNTSIEDSSFAWSAYGYTSEKPTSASNLYYYVGDTVQNASLINAGRIEEKITDINALPHIVETYSNETSGYRLWSDGYCEQWGKSQWKTTVILLKPYKDTNYIILNDYNTAKDTPLTYTVNAVYKTNSSFMFGCKESGIIFITWKSNGYIN